MHSPKDKYAVIENVQVQVIQTHITDMKRRQAVFGLFFFILGMLVMFRLFGHFAG